jgi:Zn-dependent protease with chaperone function
MKFKILFFALLFASSLSMANKTTDNFWTQKWVENTSSIEKDYQNIVHTHNWHYKNRQILHEGAQDYLQQLEYQDALYIDPELEDYLYQLVYQIHPKEFPVQQRVHLNVKVIKSVIPEAFSFTNGTILISTGMLSLIQSEDELVAVLAREIAHLTLDHNVKTYTAIKTKQTLSAIIGTGLYVATTVNSMNNGDSFWEADYLGSVVGVGSNLLSYGLLSALGVGYNRSRIYEADEVAQEWMMQNKRDVYALTQVIRRLQFFEAKQRGTNLSLEENRFFLKNRFENILKNKKYKLKPNGPKLTPIHVEYDTQISECLKTNAKLLIVDKFYSKAIPYLNRSIQSNWTTGESYLLKAIALRHTKYSETNNKTVLSLLEKATENAITDLPWIWSEKGLIHLRLKENKEALNAFIKFEEYFSEEQSETTFWTRRMIAKLEKKTN